MEARKVTIVSTTTQKKSTIFTSAETLGELKEAMREENIPFSGDTSFYEGVSKTILNNDDSQLPKDIMFKGERTNDLVILLTVQKEKFKSGRYYNRKECYVYIKNNNLSGQVMNKYGKNFTNCSTDMLNEFIEEFEGNTSNDESSFDEDTDTISNVNNSEHTCKATESLRLILECICTINDYINTFDDADYDADKVDECIEKLSEALGNTEVSCEDNYDDEDEDDYDEEDYEEEDNGIESSFSDDDIDSMMSDVL